MGHRHRLPSRRAALLAIASAVAPWPPVAFAADDFASLYGRTRASADGTGKTTFGREIAQVMGWQGAAWLERDEREREERTDLLLAELDPKPGLAVADVGAGSGYLARRLAQAVAPGGTVYAVDVQPEMVRLLESLAARSGLVNLRPLLAAADDARLPAAAVDLAVMVDVYHELEFPHEVLESIARALRPGGRLVLVEYRAEDPRVPIKPVHKMSEAQVRREVAVHPRLAWERTAQPLPWQHIVVFRRR